MAIEAKKKKIGNFFQKVGEEIHQVFIRQSLPREIDFLLSGYTFTQIREISKTLKEYSASSTYKLGDCCYYNAGSGDGMYKNIQAITTAEVWNEAHWILIGPLAEVLSGELGSWDNQNIVGAASGKNLASGSVPNCSAPNVFKSFVGDVEGSYTFKYSIQSGTSEYKVWICSNFPDQEILTADLESTLGITGVQPGVVTSTTIPEFTVVLTFDYVRQQKCKIPEVTEDMVGIVGVSQRATKQEADAAAYGQLRCISQSGTEGVEDGEIVIASYGVTPLIDIHCVVSEAFEFNRDSETPDYS